ncbi:MAG: hypothetical protein EZS28_004604, partial [Streblomastix strix]
IWRGRMRANSYEKSQVNQQVFVRTRQMAKINDRIVKQSGRMGNCRLNNKQVKELEWWANKLPAYPTNSIHPFHQSATVITDAIAVGWGHGS